MTAGHFIFIPAVLLIGVVIGWILGSRAARDAFAAELRRREEKAAQESAAREAEVCSADLQTALTADLQPSQLTTCPTASRFASTGGSPASTTFACASSMG